MEKWKEIYNGKYKISNKGRVYSSFKNRFIKGSRNKKGYLSLDIKIDGKRFCPSIHSLVALNFIGPRPEKFQINHKNGNTSDNRVDNLEYVSARHNILHSIYALESKTSLEKVDSVVRLSQEGKSRKSICEKLGLSTHVVDGILSGKTYALRTNIKRTKLEDRRGSGSHYAKLDETMVLKIRELIAKGCPLKKLAEDFNVSCPTISNIKNRDTWKHI